MRLIAINRELTHDNHVINRDYIFSSIDSPNIYIYIYIYMYMYVYIYMYIYIRAVKMAEKLKSNLYLNIINIRI